MLALSLTPRSRASAAHRHARVRRSWARLSLLALCILVLQVLLAGGASAHAELTGSTPSGEARLDKAPTEIVLRFSEDIDLVRGGLRLLDSEGGDVTTADATSEGPMVRWPMPDDLPDGAYVASWRVISSDSHPVSGAVTFGVGVEAPPPPAGADAAAPWQVTSARLLGYAAFAVYAGGFVFLSACWPRSRPHPRRARALLLGGLVAGVLASMLSMLVQGPYLAGLPMTAVTDTRLLGETGHTDFGAWVQMRLFFYIALLAIICGDLGLRSLVTRVLGVALTITTAVSFSATGHAAASGRIWDAAVDTIHVLSAGIWVGGLLMLVVADRAVRANGEGAAARFSGWAAGSVLLLVMTGTVNSVIHLNEIGDLWRTRYGVTLLVKLAVVAVALTAALLSRRRLKRGNLPRSSVRVELVATATVLAVTAVLAMTAPPSTLADSSADSSSGSSPGSSLGSSPGSTGQPASEEVRMDLGQERQAVLEVTNPQRGGSELVLRVTGSDGSPLPVNRLDLKVQLDEQELGPFPIALRPRNDAFAGTFDFALAGDWIVVLTVEDEDLAGTVTTGEITITESP